MIWKRQVEVPAVDKKFNTEISLIKHLSLMKLKDAGWQGKRTFKKKLQCLQKVWIRAFGLFVHQIISLYEVFELQQNFRRNEAVTCKTPFFVIGLFCPPHSICLNIGFWQGSFVWKCYVFNIITFNWKAVLKLFDKGFHFSENLFQN